MREFHMKYITIKLTADQIYFITNQLVLYEDLPSNHPSNAFITRINAKLNKALATAKS